MRTFCSEIFLVFINISPRRSDPARLPGAQLSAAQELDCDGGHRHLPGRGEQPDDGGEGETEYRQSQPVIAAPARDSGGHSTTGGGRQPLLSQYRKQCRLTYVQTTHIK